MLEIGLTEPEAAAFLASWNDAVRRHGAPPWPSQEASPPTGRRTRGIVTDEDLDLSAYDAAVIEHALYGLARAHVFEAIVRNDASSADLGAGTLRIGARRFRAQILGTFAKGSRTFLWAWANPDAQDWGPSLRAANSLRSLSWRTGHDVYGVRSVREGQVNPRELAYVSGELIGGFPVYAADAGPATVFMLVSDARLDPADLGITALPRLFRDFESFAMVDRSACVARFLARIGFEVTSTDGSTSGWRAQDGAAVTVEWTAEGLVGAVTLTESRAATG